MKYHIMGCEDAIDFFQAELRGILDNTGVGVAAELRLGRIVPTALEVSVIEIVTA
jgi:hypothetical protein